MTTTIDLTQGFGDIELIATLSLPLLATMTVLLVHAILGVRAQPYFFRRAGGFPGSHGPDRQHRILGLRKYEDRLIDGWQGVMQSPNAERLDRVVRLSRRFSSQTRLWQV